MGRLEERLRRLEEQLVSQPSVDEYLDAKHREEVRAQYKVVSYSADYDFDNSRVFTPETLRMLAEDTPDRQEKDREIVEAWYRARGRARAAEVEGARECLLVRLEARSKN